MELARITDDSGTTYFIDQHGQIDIDGFPFQDPILAKDALKLIDFAGLNTTANDLRAQLASCDEQNAHLIAWLVTIGCDSGQITRIATGNDVEIDCMTPREIDLGLRLSEANKTIDQLRKADTVRPDPPNPADVWYEGYDAAQDVAQGHCTRDEVPNPYR